MKIYYVLTDLVSVVVYFFVTPGEEFFAAPIDECLCDECFWRECSRGRRWGQPKLIVGVWSVTKK